MKIAALRVGRGSNENQWLMFDMPIALERLAEKPDATVVSNVKPSLPRRIGFDISRFDDKTRKARPEVVVEKHGVDRFDIGVKPDLRCQDVSPRDAIHFDVTQLGRTSGAAKQQENDTGLFHASRI